MATVLVLSPSRILLINWPDNFPTSPELFEPLLEVKVEGMFIGKVFSTVLRKLKQYKNYVLDYRILRLELENAVGGLLEQDKVYPGDKSVISSLQRIRWVAEFLPRDEEIDHTILGIESHLHMLEK